jgi:uncharacterized delta-60 repeat protein
MKKNRKLKARVLIIELLFILLYFPVQSGSINLGINNEDIKKSDIALTLSMGSSVLYEWNRTWGGSNGDLGYGVAIDSSGGIYLTGYTLSFGTGGSDIILLKYDGKGVLQWNHTWGGVYNDMGFRVAIDMSGNIYVAGLTYSFGTGGSDIILLKYNGKGVLQWNRTWGGLNDDNGYDLVLDMLGNIYITGATESFGAGLVDMILMKYNRNGELQWNRTWGGAYNDWGMGVTVDSSGNVYLAGRTFSFGLGGADMVLMKYNVNGELLWNYTWGGVENDYGNAVVVDSLDNVYLSGITGSFGAGLGDIVLVKYDSSGVQQWNHTWGGGDNDIGEGSVIDLSGNVYVAGCTWGFGAGGPDILLVKYDENGVEQWNRTWGGSDIDWGYGVAVDSSGNVYIVGETYSFGAGNNDMVLVKYGIKENPPFDGFIMILIIVFSIVSVVGVGIAIIYFIRKRRKISE